MFKGKSPTSWGEKDQLSKDLRASIAEEQTAIATYNRRRQDARNFPKIADLYVHIAREEEHHRLELQSMLDDFEK